MIKVNNQNVQSIPIYNKHTKIWSSSGVKARAALYRKKSSAGGIRFKIIVVNNVNQKLDKLSNKRALVKINH